MAQQVWTKANPHERKAVIGAGLILLSWLLGIVLSGGLFGFASAGGVGLLGAIAVVVIVYLRYSAATQPNYPLPYPTLLLAISAVVGVIALLQLIQLLGVLGILAAYGGVTVLLVLVLDWAGAALMLWGSYEEYQSTKKPA